MISILYDRFLQGWRDGRVPPYSVGLQFAESVQFGQGRDMLASASALDVHAAMLESDAIALTARTIKQHVVSGAVRLGELVAADVFLGVEIGRSLNHRVADALFPFGDEEQTGRRQVVHGPLDRVPRLRCRLHDSPPSC